MVVSEPAGGYHIANNYAMWNSRAAQHGVKRKYEEVENPSVVTYHDERQSVLNMSMCKLQLAPPPRREQSLRRSVLIFNTLRLIEGELQVEGVKLGHASPPTPSFLPALQEEDVTLDPLPGTSTEGPSQVLSCHKLPLSNSDLLTTPPASPMDCDVPSLAPVQTGLDSSSESYLPKETSKDCNPASEVTSTNTPPVVSNGDSLNLRLENHTPVPPASNAGMTFSVNFATLFDLDTNSSVDVSCTVTSTNNVAKNVGPASVVTGTASAKSLTATCKGDVEILGDLDLSLYDLDILSPSNKLTPLTAEDLMHAFPTTGSFPEAFGAMKSDLLNDDLDHLMQILVGL